MGIASLPCRGRVLLTGLLLMSMVSCGPPPPPKREYADVTGTVTYQGEPLEAGIVMFQPAVGAIVSADIQPDGTYSLKGVIGPNTVMIVSREEAPPISPDPETRVEPKSLIPTVYGTPESGLKFDIEPGDNQADFDLK